MSDKADRRIRYIAWAVALIWACWWIFFSLASGIQKGLSLVGVLCYPKYTWGFLVTAIIAWRWWTIGGIALVLEGLFLFIWYPIQYSHFSFSMIISVLSIFALPPLVAGFLFLSNRWRSGKEGTL
ncbi:MAG: hypothetical protein HOO91_08545 [Bacteroidales bacterium]|nr:hypothetical protein [Bacteroidales bacterium]